MNSLRLVCACSAAASRMARSSGLTRTLRTEVVCDGFGYHDSIRALNFQFLIFLPLSQTTVSKRLTLSHKPETVSEVLDLTRYFDLASFRQNLERRAPETVYKVYRR